MENQPSSPDTIEAVVDGNPLPIRLMKGVRRLGGHVLIVGGSF